MPRRARFVKPGLPHHITQRGNNRQEVFTSCGDRLRYIEILAEHLERHGVRVLAWCLMTNHIHLVAIPSDEGSLGLALGQAHSQYALEWNRRRERVGHLWQNRFFSCGLETDRVFAAIRYVELNPSRAGMVGDAWDWPWSSAAAHVTEGTGDILLDAGWREWTIDARLGEWSFEDWRGLLGGDQMEEEVRTLRRATWTGEPLGSERFVKELESEAGRRLRVLARGRPAKERFAAEGLGGLFE
jgi:putative transposase